VLAVALAAAGPGVAPAASTGAELDASGGATRVGAPFAWAYGATGAGVVIGLIDSGVMAAHRELGTRVLRGFNAQDGGGDTGDAVGHGTHVAGLLAAVRDGVGGAGVSPDVLILPVRVFAEGGASDAVLSADRRVQTDALLPGATWRATAGTVVAATWGM
jgi:subtilisin family serine protease